RLARGGLDSAGWLRHVGLRGGRRSRDGVARQGPAGTAATAADGSEGSTPPPGRRQDALNYLRSRARLGPNCLRALREISSSCSGNQSPSHRSSCSSWNQSVWLRISVCPRRSSRWVEV